MGFEVAVLRAFLFFPRTCFFCHVVVSVETLHQCLQVNGVKFGNRMTVAWLLGHRGAVHCASILTLLLLIFLGGFVSKVPCQSMPPSHTTSYRPTLTSHTRQYIGPHPTTSHPDSTCVQAAGMEPTWSSAFDADMPDAEGYGDIGVPHDATPSTPHPTYATHNALDKDASLQSTHGDFSCFSTEHWVAGSALVHLTLTLTPTQNLNLHFSP